MTTTDWNHLSLLIVQYIPWLVPFAAAVWAWLVKVAPWITDKRVQALAAQAVAAAENTIGDPAQRYAYVDGLLHDVFPRLSPDERHAIIEGAVTALHMALGSFQSAQPATPAQEQQAAQVAQEIAAIKQAIADLSATVQASTPSAQTKKLAARTPTGQFSGAPVAEAAHPDAS